MGDSQINVRDYTSHEIFDILKLNNPTKEMFLKKVMDLLNKTKEKETKQFLLDAKGKVLSSYFNILDLDEFDSMENEADADDVLLQNIYNARQLGEKKYAKMSRLMHIDSKYRPNLKFIGKILSEKKDKHIEYLTNPGSILSATSYKLVIQNPLSNVVSMDIESVQLPISWYTYDHCYGNTYFWIKYDENPIELCIIKAGTYLSAEDLINELTSQIETAVSKISKITAYSHVKDTPYPIIYSLVNKKISMHIDPSWSVIYFNTPKAHINPPAPSSGYTYNKSYLNHNLGWFLGYRDISANGALIYKGDGSSYPGLIEPNLSGTKTIFLSIDDYSKNYSNTSFTNILQFQTKNSLPNYYTKNIDMVAMDTLTVPNEKGYLQRRLPTTVEQAKNNLTMNQIYAANEIISSHREINIEDYMLPTPILSNEMAILPLKNMAKLRMPTMMISLTKLMGNIAIQNVKTALVAIGNTNTIKDVSNNAAENIKKLQEQVKDPFNSSAQYTISREDIVNNKRIYTTPVNIERLEIKLYDEYGFLINFNGHEWNFTLRYEQVIS